MSQEPIDSPTKWVARHLKSYVESDGAHGHLFHGAPTLLITTTGRRSGLPRRTALIYGRDGERYLVVASDGGAAAHPLWFHNLLAQPRVRVQVGAHVFDAVARPATTDERPRLWETMTGIWPHYTNYRRKAPREIPIVIIDGPPHQILADDDPQGSVHSPPPPLRIALDEIVKRVNPDASPLPTEVQRPALGNFLQKKINCGEIHHKI